eukprot:5315124-Alexandrium_andersonii.AAC.1
MSASLVGSEMCIRDSWTARKGPFEYCDHSSPARGRPRCRPPPLALVPHALREFPSGANEEVG